MQILRVILFLWIHVVCARRTQLSVHGAATTNRTSDAPGLSCVLSTVFKSIFKPPGVEIDGSGFDNQFSGKIYITLVGEPDVCCVESHSEHYSTSRFHASGVAANLNFDFRDVQFSSWGPVPGTNMDGQLSVHVEWPDVTLKIDQFGKSVEGDADVLASLETFKISDGKWTSRTGLPSILGNLAGFLSGQASFVLNRLLKDMAPTIQMNIDHAINGGNVIKVPTLLFLMFDRFVEQITNLNPWSGVKDNCGPNAPCDVIQC